MTDVHDVGKHPVLDESAHDAGNENGDHLSEEHEARGNLHVVTKLHVTSEPNRLVCANKRNAFEDHDGHGFAWKKVASHELGHNAQGDLLVGDRLDDANRDRHARSDEKRDANSPDGKPGGVDLDRGKQKNHHYDSQQPIPPLRNFRICLHKARVDVTLVLQVAPRAFDDVTTVPH